MSDGEDGAPPPHPRTAITAVLAAMVLVVMDAALVNVALPALARDLHVTSATSIWAVTAYQMALMPCAALGESLGHRRVFAGGVAVFTAASALCALSPSLSVLLVARFLQGLGGAAVMALGVALLRAIVPQQRLGAAIGWNALAVALASAAGPALGAAILSFAPWPWLFAMNLPLGAAVLLAARALPRIKGTGRRLDLVSAFLNAASFAGLVISAVAAFATPALAAALFAAAVLAVGLLIRREGPKTAPLIPLDLLREGSFRIPVAASILCFAGQAAGMVALPFYLQHGLGQGALTAGLYMSAWPITVAVVAPFVGRLAASVSAQRLCAAGGACLALGLGATALWTPPGRPLSLAFFMMLCGLGFGLFNVPNNRSMFLAAPPARSGAAGGMQGSARLLGQTAGAVIMTLLFSLVRADTAPRIGLGLAAILTLTAGAVSLLRRRPAASSVLSDA